MVTYANSTLTLLFWQVGKRINEDVLQNQRASYGKQIIPLIANGLEKKYGRNFTEKNIRRMMQFVQEFPDFQIVVTLSRQLSWSQFLILIPLKKADARMFYAELAINEALSVRELRKQIAAKAFERTQIANLQAQQSGLLPVNTFKDPYLSDFLGLRSDYLEKDIETAFYINWKILF